MSEITYEDEASAALKARLAEVTINVVMDMRGRLGETIKESGRILDQLKKQRDVCDAHIIENLNQNGLKNIATEKYRASLSEETLPQVKDWDKVHAYVIENQCMELMYKRVSSVVYRELLSTGEVPGIDSFEKSKLSFRKK